jgi:phosphocarrier protein HPr
MSPTVEKVVTVINPMGIHMRPADLLSRAAGRFESQIEIEKDGQAFDCKSIMGILSLCARQGTQLNLRARGADAREAVDVLSELFDQGFDESDSEVASPKHTS